MLSDRRADRRALNRAALSVRLRYCASHFDIVYLTPAAKVLVLSTPEPQYPPAGPDLVVFFPSTEGQRFPLFATTLRPVSATLEGISFLGLASSCDFYL